MPGRKNPAGGTEKKCYFDAGGVPDGELPAGGVPEGIDPCGGVPDGEVPFIIPAGGVPEGMVPEGAVPFASPAGGVADGVPEVDPAAESAEPDTDGVDDTGEPEDCTVVSVDA